MLPKIINNLRCKNNDIEILISCKNIGTLLTFLKLHTACQFEQLIDIVATDNPGKYYRFTVRYLLLSIRFNVRISVILQTNELTPINSSVKIYASAG